MVWFGEALFIAQSVATIKVGEGRLTKHPTSSPFAEMSNCQPSVCMLRYKCCHKEPARGKERLCQAHGHHASSMIESRKHGNRGAF